ncbi:hypothetical protein ACQP0C_20975 [Nocardia sp. CA-129566]|uniref:hypothetical protein n=1 Tax=Nocardia sp. CA-129566 TaxID=3239976 RepID=UPI003D967A92
MPEDVAGEDHQGRMNRRTALGAGAAALGGAGVGGALATHLLSIDIGAAPPQLGTGRIDRVRDGEHPACELVSPADGVASGHRRSLHPDS